ncbi:MAG: histidine kinase, partial [Dehalococcoidales bacterium]|nr:histidine kinase [Dehalococcoidales bacterium]
MNEESKLSDAPQLRRGSSIPNKPANIFAPLSLHRDNELEKQQLARQLHDVIGQPLTALKLMVAKPPQTGGENEQLLTEM